MTDETRFSLRLPRDLHALLLERAQAEHRSLNAQIVHLLWQAFAIDADAHRGTRHQVRRHESGPAVPGRTTRARRSGGR